ncbi:MAG: asparaginase [Pseudomonadota bacterium]|nr:asparaginase [Pseudomonadota bacterium]MEE3100015.1 asparaginase [Pseudomonadota bacterium]
MTEPVSPVPPAFSDGGAPLVEVIRGDFVECVHRGAAAVCDASGAVVAAWGDADRVILPRSTCKMLQGLPLVESGAADAAGLETRHLALACASHKGAEIHTVPVRAWLEAIGKSEADLRCGPQMPDDRPAREGLIRACGCPDQTHNNCSGKHTGFLTLTRHLGAGPEYVEPDHPVQRAAKEAFYAMTGDDEGLGHVVDGCSAPNFACTVTGLARAMARMADPSAIGGVRAAAAARLQEAMRAHPELVGGVGEPATEMMRLTGGAVALKSGAEGAFVAIVPGRGLGVAVKIDDGAGRAAAVAMAAILVRLGLASAADPAFADRLSPPQRNRRGILTGTIRPAAALA